MAKMTQTVPPMSIGCLPDAPHLALAASLRAWSYELRDGKLAMRDLDLVRL